MHTEPRAEHAWLTRLVGEWRYEAEAVMGPGQEPMRSEGRERVRSLGGLWIVCEGEGEMPGGMPATTVLTLGYDPRTGRYQGTWIGSMMNHLWVYDASMDESGRVLTLKADGPSFEDDGKLATYKDVLEVVSDDHRVLTSHLLKEDGSWERFMTAHYRRVS